MREDEGDTLDDAPDDSPKEGAQGWAGHLTRRGKLARGLVTFGAVAVAVVLLLAPALTSFATSSAAALAAWTGVRTPTEPAQPTLTTRGARVAQPADGGWTAIALPPGTVYSAVLPSALDPRALTACVWPSIDVGTSAQVWRTRDAGATWTTAALPAHSGERCALAAAPDAPNRIAALVFHEDSLRPACASSWLYVSDDGGASWSRTPHAPIGPTGAFFSSCEVWRAGKHLYFQTWYAPPNDLQAPERALLERSDDDGRSWSRIDGAFSASGSGDGAHVRAWPFSDGETLLASVITPDGSAIWLSRDAGRDWAQVGMIAGVYTTNLVLDASAYQIKLSADHPAYAMSNEQLPAFLFRLRALASADGAAWTPLPPLPVPGATPTRTGLTQVRGTARGGLLAMGVDPQMGVPAADNQDAVTRAATTSQWIWRWDPHSATWTAVAPAPAECGQCRIADATPGMSPDGVTGGTWIWLEDQAQDAKTVYRTFLAAQDGRATRGQ